MVSLVYKIPLLARALGLKGASRPSARDDRLYTRYHIHANSLCRNVARACLLLRASKGISHNILVCKIPCSRDALAALRPCAARDDSVSCIQIIYTNLNAPIKLILSDPFLKSNYGVILSKFKFSFVK